MTEYAFLYSQDGFDKAFTEYGDDDDVDYDEDDYDDEDDYEEEEELVQEVLLHKERKMNFDLFTNKMLFKKTYCWEQIQSNLS